jgi:hypothetical protein
MSYGKSALRWGLLGFPLGIAIATTILLIQSLGWGEGRFLVATPDLIGLMGSESGAFLLQYVLSGILGATFAACSVIFTVDEWSLLRQTATHFIITAVVMMGVAVGCRWVPLELLSILQYRVVLVVIYVIIWGIQWLYWRRRVAQVNAGIAKK